MLAFFLAIILLACPAAIGITAVSNHSNYKLVDEQGQSVAPKSMLRFHNELYFLSPDCLWWCAGAKTTTAGDDALILKKISPPTKNELSIPCQEFNDFTYLPANQTLVVLDKSGDLFEYNLDKQATKHWQVLRGNINKYGQPDPDYVSLCTIGNNLLLLDPERNQIWYLQTNAPANLQGLLPGVLAWKLKSSDINITDAIAINCSANRIYLLRKTGEISQYSITASAHPYCHSLGHIYTREPEHVRPSRFYNPDNGCFYIIERQNNRVLKILPVEKNAQCFIFPAESSLRALVVSGNGFWILNGDHLVYKANDQQTALNSPVNKLALDPRLKGLILPIAGRTFAGHPGVYPGARRLYRYGVHEGLDLFNQGGKVKVITGTPVRAACAGKIVRIDSNYRDMTYAQFNRVMRECWQSHQTSAKNEDLFRGCQVWIDSGNGLITKYAHLCSANKKLHLDDQVKQGDIIGFVGISGTGENLRGHTPAPHLHFEIWLDGRYLGWGLTPAETITLYEDIFAQSRR